MPTGQAQWRGERGSRALRGEARKESGWMDPDPDRRECPRGGEDRGWHQPQRPLATAVLPPPASPAGGASLRLHHPSPAVPVLSPKPTLFLSLALARPVPSEGQPHDPLYFTLGEGGCRRQSDLNSSLEGGGPCTALMVCRLSCHPVRPQRTPSAQALRWEDSSLSSIQLLEKASPSREWSQASPPACVMLIAPCERQTL